MRKLIRNLTKEDRDKFCKRFSINNRYCTASCPLCQHVVADAGAERQCIFDLLDEEVEIDVCKR